MYAPDIFILTPTSEVIGHNVMLFWLDTIVADVSLIENNLKKQGPFFGRTKTPDEDAGHKTLRKNIILASMSLE